MRRIMVLDNDYPSEENLYGDVFVHTRVKEYQKRAEVKVVSFFRDMPDYAYEGVAVFHAPRIEDLWKLYHGFKPESVFIHFYDRRLFDFVKKIESRVFIWVHGYEALGWYRRLFNFSAYTLLRNLHSIILPNLKQMIGLRRMIKFANRNQRFHFIFVSEWMRRLTQKDALINIHSFSIIPNPIDVNTFTYDPKNADQRKKILMIRSFSSRKYANDIAVDMIMRLSKTQVFSSLEFCIYGKGKLFKTLTAPLEKMDNVTLHEEFLANKRIPQIHRRFGIFLCPTRQDAQGVSMCEAMASGLVPLTLENTAIPEFVDNNETGILGRNAKDLADRFLYLIENPSLFLKMSAQASSAIAAKCSIENIVSRELAL